MTAPIAIGGRAVNPAIAELAERHAWVCWRSVVRDGKPTKPPFTPAGSPASSTDPTSWSSFNECWRAAFVDGRHRGIGRVLTGGDGLIGIDLDHASNADGTIAPWANTIVQAIPTYWERSPSRAGLHAWCRGTWPTAGNKRRNIEIYARARFLTVTGEHLDGTLDSIAAVDLAPLQSVVASRARADHEVVPIDIPKPMPITLVQSLARTHPQLRRILERQYPSLSQRDLALVRFAKLARWEPTAAWSLVRAARTDGKADRPDYAARTLALVY
jgi:Bifunctional DNA primase/polymerase, N-terminal